MDRTEVVVTSVPQKDKKEVQRALKLAKILEGVRKADFSPVAAKQCQYSYEEVKPIFWEILQKFMPGFNANNGNIKQVIPDMLRYFIGDASGRIPLDRGIYLHGPVGVGKSKLMECFAEFTKRIRYKAKGFRMADVQDIHRSVTRSKDLSLLDSYRKGSVCLDDLFADTQKARAYAVSVDVSQELILQYYIGGWRSGGVMHCTTNIHPDDVSKQLVNHTGQEGAMEAARVFDRIQEMFFPVELKGPSMR